MTPIQSDKRLAAAERFAVFVEEITRFCEVISKEGVAWQNSPGHALYK
jgi:hypothetical protein